MEILNDFNTSVQKALEEINPDYKKLAGLVVCGTHSPQNVEEILEKIKHAKENNIPTLGICMGMQLMLIAQARRDLSYDNLGLKSKKEKLAHKANSTEIDPNTPHPIIIKMPELRVGIHKTSWMGKTTMESYWHNYKFNEEYSPRLMNIIEYTDGIAVCCREWPGHHPFFVGVQFHPEYQSSREKPHPLLVRFLQVCGKSK